MTRHTGQDGKSVRYLAAWGGTTFFELEAKLKRAPAAPADWRNGLLMHYRIFPRTEAWGELEVEQVAGHRTAPPVGTIRSLQSGTGSFRFHPGSFETLPTLHHIVNGLAAIELGNVVADAGQAKAASWTDVHNIKVLSDTSPSRHLVSTPGSS
jgi:hypothetical protein